MEARYIDKINDCFVIELSWTGPFSFAEVLHLTGHVPLPPYIKREDEQKDRTRYQTVFARHDGSVAAPTAGLHFSEETLQLLQNKNIRTDFITLHVGAGTFKPVRTDTMEHHEMHWEFIEVEPSLIQTLIKEKNNPVIAIGTTSLRTLESLYWIGHQLLDDPLIFANTMPWLGQWEAYDTKDRYSVTEALQAILNYLTQQQHKKLVAKTQLIIAPGYSFKIVDGLVTNFHQPGSTLLLLVAAFIGQDWQKVYQYALENNFRFLSYGDGSLLWRNKTKF